MKNNGRTILLVSMNDRINVYFNISPRLVSLRLSSWSCLRRNRPAACILAVSAVTFFAFLLTLTFSVFSVSLWLSGLLL